MVRLLENNLELCAQLSLPLHFVDQLPIYGASFNGRDYLTHWDRATHIICVGKLTIIGLDNGLLPGRREAIIWTNAGILIIGPQGTNFHEIKIIIPIFWFMKKTFENVVWKMAAILSRPQCLSNYSNGILQDTFLSMALNQLSSESNGNPYPEEPWRNNDVTIVRKWCCSTILT